MRYEDMEYENFKNVLGAIDELKDPSRAMIAKISAQKFLKTLI